MSPVRLASGIASVVVFYGAALFVPAGTLHWPRAWILLGVTAGPFAGTSFSNANRTSVGCKSPLTGGIKEANGGGTFSYGLGQLQVAGFTLHGTSPGWVVLHFRKDGGIDFDDATPYLGKGNFEAAALLHTRYGKKVTISVCGLVGEYQGLIAGIAFSDKDNRPSRLSARGGVGAVMGSKRVKAVVVDLDRIPPFHDRQKVNAAVKDYAKMLQADGIVQNFYSKLGTMGMADVQNHMGGLPVRNFSAGRLAETSAGETFKLGPTTSAPSTLRGVANRRTRACRAASSNAATSITTRTGKRSFHRSNTRPSGSLPRTAASPSRTISPSSTFCAMASASTRSRRARCWPS